MLAKIGASDAVHFRYRHQHIQHKHSECVVSDHEGYLAVANYNGNRSRCLKSISLRESTTQLRTGSTIYQEMIVGLPNTESVLCPINSRKDRNVRQWGSKLKPNQSIDRPILLKQDTASYYIKMNDNESGETSCPDNTFPHSIQLLLRNISHDGKHSISTKKRKSNSQVCKPSVRKRVCTIRARPKSMEEFVQFDASKQVVLYINLAKPRDGEETPNHSLLHYVYVENSEKVVDIISL
jgi:hypothetical protein